MGISNAQWTVIGLLFVLLALEALVQPQVLALAKTVVSDFTPPKKTGS